MKRLAIIFFLAISTHALAEPVVHFEPFFGAIKGDMSQLFMEHGRSNVAVLNPTDGARGRKGDLNLYEFGARMGFKVLFFSLGLMGDMHFGRHKLEGQTGNKIHGGEFGFYFQLFPDSFLTFYTAFVGVGMNYHLKQRVTEGDISDPSQSGGDNSDTAEDTNANVNGVGWRAGMGIRLSEHFRINGEYRRVRFNEYDFDTHKDVKLSPTAKAESFAIYISFPVIQ